MTRLEIRDLIRKRLGETTAAFWSDAELNSWINDACTDVAFRTKCIRENIYVTPITNTAEYVLSALVPNVLSINEVYHKTNGLTWTKLENTSRTELDLIRPGWKSAIAGPPDEYYYSREENVFGFYPKPDATNSVTNYAQIYYTKAHIDISDDAASPQLPENVQNAVCDYVVASGFEQRGWGDKANDSWQKYFTKLRDYQIERHRETEDEDLIMKSVYNL